MKKVSFVILDFIDSRKSDCTLVVHKIYTGDFDLNKSVYITDNQTDFVFFNMDTCIVIPDNFDNIVDAKEFASTNLPKQMDIIIIESQNKFYIDNPDAFLRSFESIILAARVEFIK
jgi:hypothetical protein